MGSPDTETREVRAAPARSARPVTRAGSPAGDVTDRGAFVGAPAPPFHLRQSLSVWLVVEQVRWAGYATRWETSERQIRISGVRTLYAAVSTILGSADPRRVRGLTTTSDSALLPKNMASTCWRGTFALKTAASSQPKTVSSR